MYDFSISEAQGKKGLTNKRPNKKRPNNKRPK